MTLATRAKRFLHGWNVFMFVFGITMSVMISYIFIFDKGHFAVPSIIYYSGLIGGGLMVVVSVLGYVGLRVHQYKLSQGRRNYALGMYVIILGIICFLVMMGGFLGFTLGKVSSEALERNYEDQRVQYLEQAVIEALETLSHHQPEDWVKVQNGLLCCGYDNPNELGDFLSDKYLDDVEVLNANFGDLCTTDTDYCKKEHTTICPRTGKIWCREQMLLNAQNNNKKIGTLSVVLGSAQILAFLLAVYILLCDVPKRKSSQHRDPQV